MTPTDAIIIPHYNDVTRLCRCLERLVPQTEASPVEIIVADNGTDSDALNVVRDRWPAVRIVVENEKGAGPARNRGVAESRASTIFFLDADCVPSDDWVAAGRRAVRDNTITGGPVEIFHETDPPHSGAEVFEAVFAFKMKRYFDDKKFLGAGNLVLPKAVFDQVGGFRAAVSEDVEWSRRAAAMGVTLAFDDEFAAFHPSRQDWPKLRGKWRRIVSETFQLEVDGASTRIAWMLRALAMPVSALVHAPRVLRHSGLSTSERIRGVLTLFRIRLARMGWMLMQSATGRP